MTSWCRLWHEMPTDPKWRTISRASGQPLVAVVAVYTFMLADASANATERGRTQANDEDIASAFDIDLATVSAIRQAMQGRVLDGDRLTGWESRQPKREDNSADRAKAWRDLHKPEKIPRKTPNATERNRTQANDTDTESDTDKKEKDLCPKPRKTRVSYQADFEDFWKDYPTDANMSKSEAYAQWQRLTVEDRAKAKRAVPHFVTHCRTHPDYRPIHAERWLSNRRFDGFAELADKLDALRAAANVVPIERPPPKPIPADEPEFRRSPEIAAEFEKLSRSLG